MGGSFTKKSITELSVVASNAALESANIKPEQIDNVVFGNVLPVSCLDILMQANQLIKCRKKFLIEYKIFFLKLSSSDGAFMPRHVLLKCGIPLEKPALGVNRLCGSGFQAIVSGAQVIQNFNCFYKFTK